MEEAPGARRRRPRMPGRNSRTGRRGHREGRGQPCTGTLRASASPPRLTAMPSREPGDTTSTMSTYTGVWGPGRMRPRWGRGAGP